MTATFWFTTPGFRQDGLAAQFDVMSGSRPMNKFGGTEVRVIRCRSTSRGVKSRTRWPKHHRVRDQALIELRKHLISQSNVTAISRETLRRDPARPRRGLADQHLGDEVRIGWRHQVLTLYDHPPTETWSASTSTGRRTCNPAKATPGDQSRNPRQRAIYNRHHGVMHMLLLEPTTGKIYYRIRDREQRREFLDLLTTHSAPAGPASSFHPLRQHLSPPTRKSGLARRPPDFDKESPMMSC